MPSSEINPFNFRKKASEMAKNYHEEIKIKNILRLRQHQKELPAFLVDFFRAVTDTTSSRTRIGYAYDLKIFFNFLSEEISKFDGRPVKDFTIEDLRRTDSADIEEFMEYLSYYVKNIDGNTKEYQNEERGKARKLSAIRTMFSYFYKKRLIDSDPSDLVDLPKIHDKAIIRLDVDEVSKLLDEVENGEYLSERQKKIHEHTKIRDLAIVTLLLGTGMRVSECVGVDLGHIDFNNSSVKVTRKGGNESVLYFGEEVEAALKNYLEQRQDIMPVSGHENAFFLSLQRKRITDRAIQILVKKYSKFVTGFKKISPHKLRSTYGTNLYRESGDIYLVADVLGHVDVNTTKKHYAAMDEDRRRSAAKLVKLRKE